MQTWLEPSFTKWNETDNFYHGVFQVIYIFFSCNKFSIRSETKQIIFYSTLINSNNNQMICPWKITSLHRFSFIQSLMFTQAHQSVLTKLQLLLWQTLFYRFLIITKVMNGNDRYLLWKRNISLRWQWAESPQGFLVHCYIWGSLALMSPKA